jgi:hypothetical protein
MLIAGIQSDPSFRHAASRNPVCFVIPACCQQQSRLIRHSGMLLAGIQLDLADNPSRKINHSTF